MAEFRSGQLVLVPLFFFGALVAALYPKVATGPKADAASAQASSDASDTSGSRVEGVTDALDLLSEHFGVDLQEAALRLTVSNAARRVRMPDYELASPSSREDVLMLRAYYCGRVESDDSDRSRFVALLSAALRPPVPLPPACRELTEVAASAETADSFRDALWTFPDEGGLKTDWDAVRWAVVDSAAAVTPIEFMVATLPDPVDSYETWQFDSDVAALREGIADSGYLVDRFFFPDVQHDKRASTTGLAASRAVHERSPGVVLFRRGPGSLKVQRGSLSTGQSSSTDPVCEVEAESLLVLFLVPETPVSGIHLESFLRAVSFSNAWRDSHRYCDEAPELRVLGPRFSGSVPSLVRGLERAPRGQRPSPVRIVTGTASNDSNAKLLRRPSQTVPSGLSPVYTPPLVSFSSTAQSNSAVQCGISRFLRAQGITGPIAVLSESDTAYGAALAGPAPSTAGEDCPEQPRSATVRFPFNIAQLRSDENRDGRVARNPPSASLPGFRPLSLADAAPPTDQFPILVPTMASSSVELVLSGILDELRRRQVRVVQIEATDVRDKLFLIQRIRQRIPDALVIVADADLFQIHPDEAPWLRGVIVASTYPLDGSTQDNGSGVLRQFPNSYAQGIYNAAVALLNYDASGARLQMAPPSAWLTDYVSSQCGGDHPGVWISTVGRGGMEPLAQVCGGTTASGSYMFGLRDTATAQEQALARTPVSRLSKPTVVWLLFWWVVAGLLFWLGRRYALHAPQAAAVALGLCGPAFVLPSTAVLSCALAYVTWSTHGFDRTCLDVLALTACSIVVFAMSVVGESFAQLAREASRHAVDDQPSTADFVVAAVHIATRRLTALLGVGAAVAVAGWTASPAPVAHGPLWTLLVLEVGVVCGAIVYAQTDGPLRRWRSACLVAGAATAGWVTTRAFGPDAFWFAQRSVQIELGATPLAFLTAAAAIPLTIAGLEYWRLLVLGESQQPLRDSSQDLWKETVRHAMKIAGPSRRVEDWSFVGPRMRDPLGEALWRIGESLWTSVLPQRSPVLLCGASAVVVAVGLGMPMIPQSVEGRWAGVVVLATVLFVQCLFALAIADLWLAHNRTFELLHRLRQGPRDLPYKYVPKELLPDAILASRPRMVELRFFTKGAPAVAAAFEDDLGGTSAVRWYRTRTWALLLREFDGFTRVGGPNPGGTRLRTAVGVVFVVRELLARLGFCIATAFAPVALLIGLYLSFPFDRSHRLLGIIWFDAILAVTAVMTIFVRMERDVILSETRNRNPGQIDWSWEFISKVLVYGVLPLATLFAAQFPGIGGGILPFMEPVSKLP